MKKDYSIKANELLTYGYQISISDIISESWEIMKKNMGQFIVFGLISLVISFGAGLIPIVGQIISIALGPAILAGFIITAHDANQNQPVNINRFFEGFSRLGDLLPAYLVGVVFIAIGMVLLIIPGIYLAVCYFLLVPFLIFSTKQGGLIDQLELVRKVSSKNWFQLFLLIIVMAFINLGGAILCGIGLLITVPLTYISAYVTFKNIFGLPDEDEQDQEFYELKV
jgi:uncharacterized membrane protein